MNFEHQEIMNLQLSPRMGQLYTTKDSHFRPQIADEAISILVAQAIEEMRRSEGLPVLVVAGWNACEQDMHVEMLAVQALARCRTVRDMSEVAQQFGHRSWSLRFYHFPKLQQEPVPNLLFQTYVHDNKPEPASVAKTMFPEFRRQFCDDQLLRKTLQELAGKLGTALLDRLKQPAHRADIFRYVYHFQHGGLYLDIKCGFVVPWQRVLEHLAADWSTAHSSAAQRAGYNPAPAGQLPGEFMVMAIGVKPDHIFQGIIYHKPNHPLLRQAIQHAFGRQVFAAKANLEHMILCKYLWEVLKKDMGRTPAVGWNVSPTCGPIYLFQERRGRKPPLCDGQWHDAGNGRRDSKATPPRKSALTKCCNPT